MKEELSKTAFGTINQPINVDITTSQVTVSYVQGVTIMVSCLFIGGFYNMIRKKVPTNCPEITRYSVIMTSSSDCCLFSVVIIVIGKTYFAILFL